MPSLKKHEDVTLLALHSQFIVSCVGKQPDRQAGNLDLFGLPPRQWIGRGSPELASCSFKSLSSQMA